MQGKAGVIFSSLNCNSARVLFMVLLVSPSSFEYCKLVPKPKLSVKFFKIPELSFFFFCVWYLRLESLIRSKGHFTKEQLNCHKNNNNKRTRL
jgi:hypothetical protein